jgi:hypothetical protein
MAPLQRLKVKPIDDPTEQVALDERLKRSEETTAEHTRQARRSEEKSAREESGT